MECWVEIPLYILSRAKELPTKMFYFNIHLSNKFSLSVSSMPSEGLGAGSCPPGDGFREL